MFSQPFRRLLRHTFTKNTFKVSFYSIRINPEFDIDYLYDINNVAEIENNITHRKGVGNIKLIHDLKNQLETNSPQKLSIQNQLSTELFKIPNRTHPEVIKYGSEPKVVRTIGTKRHFSDKPKDFEEIVKRLKLVRTDQLGNLSGSRSYYILGEMAELEQALIRYVISNLLKNGFQLVSVPDILSEDIIEACGMSTKGARTQVYSLDPKLHGPGLCLSGTSEMALAAFLSNKEHQLDELPLRLAAVSRCYRAETSNLLEERGIYRVHEFTKVEMFIASRPEDSEGLLEEIRQIQEQTFESLGIYCQVLDMPPHELGAPAYRKYDLEAWLAGRQRFGEISSCSNCLDYQSRRLGIKYRNKDGKSKFVHTLNGTACAIPRLLIALTEGGQNPNGTIDIPEALQVYMDGKKTIGQQKKIPQLKLNKTTKK